MAKKPRWEGLLLALNGDWWTSTPPAADDPTCFLTVPVRAVLRAGQAARARGYRIDEIRISPRGPRGIQFRRFGNRVRPLPPRARGSRGPPPARLPPRPSPIGGFKAYSSTLHHLGTIEARVNAALL